MIKFNQPAYVGQEKEFILNVLNGGQLSGDGNYSKKCHEWFEMKLAGAKCMLTPSCTAALEMAAILIDIRPGDEVIMPSYTFVSTANAFVLRGAKVVFIDIRPDTMNIDETRIEEAITPKTKAIVPVHYAGVGCDMKAINKIAEKHSLYVIEDAAQGMLATLDGAPLGTLGHIGAYSFHETKNYTSGGEGGLLIVNDAKLQERAEIIREKGTNRSQFFRGAVDKYTWVDIGSSYLPSELQAAYLWAQLVSADQINDRRRNLWYTYRQELEELEARGVLSLPYVPDNAIHNAHMFYVKLKDLNARTQFIAYMSKCGVTTAFHYVPLHSAPAGLRYSVFSGDDIYTTQESERLVRLPIYYSLGEDELLYIINCVKAYFA